MTSRVFKVTAAGVLTVFVSEMGHHIYSLPSDPTHEPPEGFALVATSTASETIVTMNTVSGEEIQLPSDFRRNFIDDDSRY